MNRLRQTSHSKPGADFIVTALAGGVGGAKLADGLSRALPGESLTVLVNTGDDFEHLGLLVCPDLDTVCYTLAGLANPVTGWGRADETWMAMETLEVLGGPTWFRLGDRDLGWHLERTRRIEEGQLLSQITAHLCSQLGIKPKILPMSDERVLTRVYTTEGELSFQEYFVLRKCQPQITGFHFSGIEKSLPAGGVLEALDDSELVVICPSNPWVSIGPILAVPGIRSLIASKPVVAVSPIIKGQAVKGPAAKMYSELGIQPSALAVARHYAGLLQGFVIDHQDADLAGEVESLNMQVLVTDVLMNTDLDRLRLAQEVFAFGCSLLHDR